jgi:hypothetical protein
MISAPRSTKQRLKLFLATLELLSSQAAFPSSLQVRSLLGAGSKNKISSASSIPSTPRSVAYMMQQRCGAASKTSCQDTRSPMAVSSSASRLEGTNGFHPRQKLDVQRRILASAPPLGEGLRCIGLKMVESCTLTNPLFGHRPGCPLESRSLFPPRPFWPPETAAKSSSF